MADLDPDAAPPMMFDVVLDGEATAIVTVTGELDIANIDAVEAAVAPMIGGELNRLIVDIGGLRFADTSAIAMWVRWARSVAEIELRHPSPLLARVISSMGLEHTLQLKP